jgi:hypothetical protein
MAQFQAGQGQQPPPAVLAPAAPQAPADAPAGADLGLPSG